MAKIKLDSDFVDYYDHFMDLDGELMLQRHTVPKLNRIETYKALNMVGLKTPKFGMVAELYKDLGTQNGGVSSLKSSGYGKLVELVVFIDIHAHAGEGKEKMSLDDARKKYPGHFAAQFIPTAKTFASRTERLVVMGDRQFWLEYTSKDDWRSNSGDVTITEIDNRYDRGMRGPIYEINSPLYAIDFVAIGHERLAIDFSVAPRLDGTPIQNKLPAEQAAQTIKSRFCELNGIITF